MIHGTGKMLFVIKNSLAKKESNHYLSLAGRRWHLSKILFGGCRRVIESVLAPPSNFFFGGDLAALLIIRMKLYSRLYQTARNRANAFPQLKNHPAEPYAREPARIHE